MLNHIKNGLKSVGSTVAKATVAIKDGATAGLSKIKSMLGTLAKGVTITVGLAGAGAAALVGGSISQGASLEQSMGGVETLFKGDASTVMANASAAYKTAGLSANAYMEQVTSFSASLLNSLGGDTAKSAQIADMAMIDMADNANKFGTDMGSIQNAYQGFAKQNYTMLDNLKLGYGGTQEEMARLLTDATKLTGVKYDMDNLADVYSAIHAIQDNLGVTGTTAKEASVTFAGSFATMKASAQNLLGNLAIGGDVKGSMEQLVDSTVTFLFDNAIPMIGRIFEGLPDAIGVAIEKGAPKVKELGVKLITSLKDGLKSALPSDLGAMVDPAFEGIGSTIQSTISTVKSVMQSVAPVAMKAFGAIGECVSSAVEVVKAVMPTIITTIQTVVTNMAPVIETFKNIFVAAMPIIQQIIQGVCTFISGIMPTVSSVFQVVGSIIQQVLNVIGNHMGLFQSIVSTVVTVVTTVWNTLAPVISAVASAVLTVLDGMLTGIEAVFNFLAPFIQTIWDSICGFFDAASSTISTVVETLQNIFQTLYDVVSSVFSGISDAVSTAIGTVTGLISGAIDAISGFIGSIGDAISSVGDFISSGAGKVKSFFGFAYGKDRVPYDNYPAVLHQGEKVLTRNQADQYDRAMSTRGVQLTKSVQPLERDDGTKTPTGEIKVTQDTPKESKGGTTVNIEKLADTVVIEKEADVDKVVEDMVKKFRKLVPNMP